MRGFRRRRPAPATAVEQLGGTGQSLAGPTGPPSDPRAAMRRIAAEAVILQDEAESVIRGARAREGLGFLAPRGGPLVRRFFSLRDLLPEHATTLPTRSGAAGWTRSCTTTPWRCGLQWTCLLMNGGRRGSLASSTRLTGWAPRPFSLTSSMPSSRDGRLITHAEAIRASRCSAQVL